ncbi:acylneuraminate cytidylyltransferase family protein [Acuticoccus yangtzensis]|uniref:acylneuraminate cytidylyltransferase family protein n=1 Tax=Acuticoccus yangtzensis TaxID=1443441 RepID=UPI000949788A|nr:acylneuraminate cytidylyltransferase family protein [Acuticoccus yangtzensis]
MTTIAIVPMKGHSARVPRKNLKPMCGRPLYHWITRTLMAVNGIDRVVIETDADEIAADVATHFPDLQVLRRPERLHGDEVPMNAILDNAMAQLEPGATFVQSHSTNPLLKPATVEKGLADYRAPGDHDSLFAVTRWQTRFFWSDGRPVNHNPDELLPTQDLPPLLEENSNLYVFTKKSFDKRHHRIGTAPKMLMMDYIEAVDIDEIQHFDLAEALLEKAIQRGEVAA